MKKSILIFTLICSIFVYGQNAIRVNYETIENPKIVHNGLLPESIKQQVEKQILQDAKKPLKFVLYYNDGNSFFQNDPNEYLPPTRQKTEYFRLKNKEGLYMLGDYIVEEFYGYYPMNDIKIEFTNEKQVIENYNCKLALYTIGNTTSKVWYTEDIPISVGPYNFYKVPGLILKVENVNFLCYAVNISKNIDKKELKKMNPDLKIYEGDELKQKHIDGKEKMTDNSRKKADEMMKSLQDK